MQLPLGPNDQMPEDVKSAAINTRFGTDIDAETSSVAGCRRPMSMLKRDAGWSSSDRVPPAMTFVHPGSGVITLVQYFRATPLHADMPKRAEPLVFRLFGNERGLALARASTSC